jgi:hypothetical protein
MALTLSAETFQLEDPFPPFVLERVYAIKKGIRVHIALKPSQQAVIFVDVRWHGRTWYLACLFQDPRCLFLPEVSNSQRDGFPRRRIISIWTSSYCGLEKLNVISDSKVCGA